MTPSPRIDLMATGALLLFGLVLGLGFAPDRTKPRGVADLETGATAAAIPSRAPRAGRARPLIAVLGYTPATEVTDYVVPYGILAASEAADVVALGTESGPIRMRPALRFQPHATLGEFDARHPEGADYVVVPNIYEGAEDRRLLEWVRRQASRGAVIVGICDGVPVLANAGLLEGRRATGHWRTIGSLERRHPSTRWTRNRRWIADGDVVTTSGVSASIPVSIALVEAIAGRERAEQIAAELGVAAWSPVHDSSRFTLRGKLLAGLRNKAAFWRHETVGVEVGSGVDEIALALTADAWSRTRRSWVRAVARSDDPILTRGGLTLVPDVTWADRDRLDAMLPGFDGVPAAPALDASLEGIAERYGERTAELVAVQIEYAWEK